MFLSVINLRNHSILKMSERKRFSELSKSQKNRRLKKRCEQAILETARAKASVDTSFDNDPVINNSVMNNDNNYDSDDFSLQSIHLDNTVTDISLKTYTDNNDNSHCTTTKTTSTVTATTTTTSITYNNNNNNNCDIEVPIPLTKQLAQWKCEFNITQAGSSALLKIIRNVESIEELKSLPNDSRTLIDTPTDTTIREVAPGEYFHYGLKEGLIDQLKIVDIKQITDIQISIHIDGLPISKSSKRQLYPILGEIFPKVSVPFVIGIYHGLNKPND
ncbi:uncharacterized protein LOC141532116 [Cotesia typhae]|uniref:uncharacterized protein LOC141532116 n=1 Tax=Cotesia typhae TaxID=2053667 RepID=UPI003D69068A